MAKGKPVSDEKKKDRQKGLLGAGLSAAFSPAIKKWFEQAATTLPEDHWMRNSELFRRGFPALTTWLENVSDELPVWAGAIVEQIIDGTDAFTTALDISTKAGKAPTTTTAAANDKWINQFVSGVPKRLQDVKDLAEKKQELKRIEEEFKLLKQLNDFIKKQQTSAQPPPPAATPAKSFEERIGETTSSIRSFREKLQAAAAQRKGGN